MEKNWYLSKILYEFDQEGNTDGTTDKYEKMSIEVQGFNSIEEEGGYHVLRTSTGWSFNDSKELIDLLEVVRKGVSSDAPPGFLEKDSDLLPD